MTATKLIMSLLVLLLDLLDGFARVLLKLSQSLGQVSLLGLHAGQLGHGLIKLRAGLLYVAFGLVHHGFCAG